ncbi:AraC family transcriptional regulator [Photobacterium rosenbergii]|uniref:AraC family transcriptional regulator n=1 Tax=Photobacterium rosenbergii TaxID=294936 RepID=A0ABU3ZKP6_9GAMM|nr:AraC family transcriptional regulator [Photobacterium rosenbergii]MDV5170703.1 AraC family transcriptional regulator [Photobacterium rosenbergii]
MNNSKASQTLVDQVRAYSSKEGSYTTEIPGLEVHIRNTPTAPLHCIYSLGFSLILQGSKKLAIDNMQMPVEAGQSMLTTFDTPIVSHVTEATRHQPFLAIVLKLDYDQIMQACAELKLDKPDRNFDYHPISIQKMDDGIYRTMGRLLELVQEPEYLHSLIPLIKQELIIRLLHGPHGMQLRHIASMGSPSNHILKIVTWMKKNFTETVRMNELADQAHMSASSFRLHFKALTGSSPLQYLKNLRLQEAREQMLLNGLDATQASNLVGYESASQFSREYSRLFGLPPQKDIQRLRQN